MKLSNFALAVVLVAASLMIALAMPLPAELEAPVVASHTHNAAA